MPGQRGWLGMRSATPDPMALWRLGLDGWMLWADASAVIALRTLRFWQPDAGAQREAQRMVNEKLLANAMLGWAMLPALFAGAAPLRVVALGIAHYARPVRANRRRLSARPRR